TGSSLRGNIYDPVGDESYEISEHGIAVIDRMVKIVEQLIVSAGGAESVVFAHRSGAQTFNQYYWDYYDYGDYGDYEISVLPHSGGWSWWGSQNANSRFWTALQLDRTLFQRNDTINLWGFIQSRQTEEEINFVTAVLTERTWYWRSQSGNDILHRQNISVTDGAYSDEISLPHVDPGSYEIAIYHGDILLNTIYFTVMDYVKPPYQLTVEASRVAIFAGDEITFTASTEFFEGTPVPDLDVSHNVWGSDLTSPGRDRGKTNIDGVIQVSARPTASNDRAQGERTLQFAAEATLPEIGQTYEHSSVRVFINDINVRPRAFRDGRDATLNVDVHNITLDRLNDGTAVRWNDYLADARANQRISVEIVEHWWERVADGTYYDHVTRQSATRYRYVHRTNSLERFELTTNADGHATRNFTVPNTERRSYEARLRTTDGNGRTILHNVFIGRDYSNFYRSANDNRLFLDGANPEGYDIGDTVGLTIMRGEEAVTQGNFLFVVVQGGILSYHIGTNPLNLTFGEQHIPNAQVFAYHFNGHTYNTGGQMAQRLRFNPTNRELIITVTPNQEAYRPGETPTFTITTTDANGNPKPANVNISLVDEALFALMDYSVDTLEMLYRNIGDSLALSLATHRTFSSSGIDDYAVDETAEADMAGGGAMNAMPTAPSATPAAERGADGGEATRIRERFEDTAMFANVRTNAQGVATISFPLPDNITSWRVTSSAISNDLYAGNSVQNIRVTLPMFLHYTLNSTFLTGDIPTIGINAYGTSLAGGEQATFRVYRENAPDDVRTATGAAFERVNIPLWEMSEEGFGAIIVQVNIAGTSFSDAIKHEYQVLYSHRLVDNAVFYDGVTTSTVFDVNRTGLTNITFTDRGRGQFLRDLYSLRHVWWSGARIEGLIARREANALIQRNFPDIRLYGDAGNFDVINYQTSSGGIAILPYSEAELHVTVMLMPFILEDVNTNSLRGYLRNIYGTSSTDNKMLALYGLAMLREPVLLDLQNYAQLENLSVRNSAYVALGFAALGDTQSARNIYTQRIAPSIQAVGENYRVNAGANNREILDATSVAALLAAQLGMPEALGLHRHSVQHRFDAVRYDANFNALNFNDMMMQHIERLLFISYEIENYNDSAAAITYTLFGETFTRQLGRGGSYTLRIPAQNMHQFNLTSVTGEVGAVSIVREPLEDIEPTENDIRIRREYFREGSSTPSTTFRQDEIVRVQITVDYSATDINGTYVITDFLPAGLVYVANSARFGSRANISGSWAYARTEGARITFYDYNSRFNRNHSYFYYARVINPGTFRAEGTLVQSLGAREYMVVGDDAVLTIN
ncbi:MAG: hypothetical protein LBI27_10310, partial [Clostridiales bacterium]|nr:hypothetical protein [Clostridiales bacterium]